MLQFANEEIVIPPGGPAENERFHTDRQPLAALWFNAVDSGLWWFIATTGPTQDGKTFLISVAVMYFLFECKETVIYAAPDLDMAFDKWTRDIKPLIEASRYRELLPDEGSGSKNGKVKAIRFKNGVVLKFMSGGGGDENRSGYTSRILVITEADKMDKRGGESREADKITQLLRRVDAHGKNARIFMECNVSYKQGRIWQEITQGTDSRICLPCPHCHEYVTPERKHLVGWREAPDEITAGANAAICCPSCGSTWSEAQRVEANRRGVLAHRGQTVQKDGTVIGELPRTDTFGFRWSRAVNSVLNADSVDLVAREEWRALRAADEDNAERALVQFRWALPFEPPGIENEEMDYHAILRRAINEPRGRVPSDGEFVVVAIDVNKTMARWICLALRSDRTPHVVEYGIIEIPAAQMEEKRALLLALREFRDGILLNGWESDAGPMHAELVLIDHGYLGKMIEGFCRESGGLEAGFAPAKGFGVTQYLRQSYHHPRKASESVAFLGDQYHIARVAGEAGSPRVKLFDINADHWKSQLHAALRVPVGRAGGLTLHQTSIDEHGKPRINDHLTLAKHFTAERPAETFEAGVGRVVRWYEVNRNNHYLDAGSMGMVALDYVLRRRERASVDRPSLKAARSAGRITAEAQRAQSQEEETAGIDESGDAADFGELSRAGEQGGEKQSWFKRRA